MKSDTYIFQRQIIWDTIVITLTIPCLDANNAEFVSRRLAEEMRGEDQIVLDLGALRYFDVSGFAAILKWAATGGDSPSVRLCSQSGPVQALFELLGANVIIPLFRNREEAVASFGRAESSRRDTPERDRAVAFAHGK